MVISTTLLTRPAALVAAVLTKETSLDETGGPLGVQFTAVDQFVSAPPPLHWISGLKAAVEAIVIVNVVELGVMDAELEGLLFAQMVKV